MTLKSALTRATLLARRKTVVNRAPSPAASALGWINLVWIGLLPAIATFGVVQQYGGPGLGGSGESARPVIAIVGFAAVAVELAALVTYTRFPSSVLTAIFVLVDGPALALLSCRSDPSVFDFAVRSFAIDGTAVWLAIAALALTTRKLVGRRAVPVAIMAGMIACTLAVLAPYLAHRVPRTFDSLGPLVGGLIWSSVVNYRVLASDEIVREGGSGASMGYVLGLAALWLVAYGLGVALH